ncbi:MAG: glycoside hydrolase family 5 protein [Acidobacteria bacterium]|nr:glycoside hydrolase family 5 protein [Acidobacteriota bacterium]
MTASRKVRCIAALFLVVVLTSFAVSQTAPPPTVSPAVARAQHLRRGINLSEWFAQVWDKRGYTREHFETWTTVDDIALIKSMGFDHVRLSVNPQPMFTMNQPQKLPPEYLSYLDAAVKMILDHGLVVVIDMHPESDFKQRLAKDDSFVEQFSDFWRAVAQHYSAWDPDRVIFEVLNEPELGDRYRWVGVQTKLASAIREGAPKHTIIAAGARWSDDDDLLFQEPLRDPNVIYNFHFYEPHIFTHQGATWGEYYWHWLKGLHYPSTPETAEQVAMLVPSEVDRLRVIRYGRDHWDAARMESEMKQAAEWADRRGVSLVCNEFGVYRMADPQDRVGWIHDVRVALEHNKIGWTMWDYSGSFGVVTKKDGRAIPDDGALKALGLK